jgi:hypothetical protein
MATRQVARDIEDLEMPTGFREALSDLEKVSLNQIWEDVRMEAAIALEEAGWLKHVEELARQALAKKESKNCDSEDEFADHASKTELRAACQTISADLKKQLLEHISSIVRSEVEMEPEAD